MPRSFDIQARYTLHHFNKRNVNLLTLHSPNHPVRNYRTVIDSVSNRYRIVGGATNGEFIAGGANDV